MSKILIADDSQFMRGILKDIVEGAGHTAVEAENGTQVLEKLVSESPDLVLLDIIMPELDGFGVLQQQGQQAKFIVISAVGQEKMVQEARAIGALDYITKPFEASAVIAAINKALE
jgi:two-component system, chemotaxis family, chemotaxis protein CheY